MKLLLDQNLSHKLCQRLHDVFPDSQQARLAGLAEADDFAIWEFAKKHDLIIVTHDADFYELSSLYSHPPKVIWLRCGNQKTKYIENILRANSERIQAFSQEPLMGCLEIY